MNWNYNKGGMVPPLSRGAIPKYDAQGHGPIFGFVNGGQQQQHPDAYPDVIDAKLRSGEYVLRPEAVQALGGVAAVDQLNGMGGPNRPEDFMEVPPPMGDVPMPGASIQKLKKKDRYGNETEITFDTKASPGARDTMDVLQSMGLSGENLWDQWTDWDKTPAPMKNGGNVGHYADGGGFFSNIGNSVSDWWNDEDEDTIPSQPIQPRPGSKVGNKPPLQNTPGWVGRGSKFSEPTVPSPTETLLQAPELQDNLFGAFVAQQSPTSDVGIEVASSDAQLNTLMDFTGAIDNTPDMPPPAQAAPPVYTSPTSNALTTIADFEGFEPEAYQDSAGIWTIGFGRTTNPDGSPVQPGQTSTREAELPLFEERVEQDKQAVIEYGQAHGYDWDPGQIDALTSFTYNLGQGGLDQLTAGGDRTNDEIARMIGQYNKAGGKFVQGLQNRRDAETELFTGGGHQMTADEMALAGLEGEVAARQDDWFSGPRNKAQRRLDTFNLSQSTDYQNPVPRDETPAQRAFREAKERAAAIDASRTTHADLGGGNIFTDDSQHYESSLSQNQIVPGMPPVPQLPLSASELYAERPGQTETTLTYSQEVAEVAAQLKEAKDRGDIFNARKLSARLQNLQSNPPPPGEMSDRHQGAPASTYVPGEQSDRHPGAGAYSELSGRHLGYVPGEQSGRHQGVPASTYVPPPEHYESSLAQNQIEPNFAQDIQSRLNRVSSALQAAQESGDIFNARKLRAELYDLKDQLDVANAQRDVDAAAFRAGELGQPFDSVSNKELAMLTNREAQRAAARNYEGGLRAEAFSAEEGRGIPPSISNDELRILSRSQDRREEEQRAATDAAFAGSSRGVQHGRDGVPHFGTGIPNPGWAPGGSYGEQYGSVDASTDGVPPRPIEDYTLAELEEEEAFLRHSVGLDKTKGQKVRAAALQDEIVKRGQDAEAFRAGEGQQSVPPISDSQLARLNMRQDFAEQEAENQALFEQRQQRLDTDAAVAGSSRGGQHGRGVIPHFGTGVDNPGWSPGGSYGEQFGSVNTDMSIPQHYESSLSGNQVEYNEWPQVQPSTFAGGYGEVPPMDGGAVPGGDTPFFPDASFQMHDYSTVPSSKDMKTELETLNSKLVGGVATIGREQDEARKAWLEAQLGLNPADSIEVGGSFLDELLYGQTAKDADDAINTAAAALVNADTSEERIAADRKLQQAKKDKLAAENAGVVEHDERIRADKQDAATKAKADREKAAADLIALNAELDGATSSEHKAAVQAEIELTKTLQAEAAALYEASTDTGTGDPEPTGDIPGATDGGNTGSTGDSTPAGVDTSDMINTHPAAGGYWATEKEATAAETFAATHSAEWDPKTNTWLNSDGKKLDPKTGKVIADAVGNAAVSSLKGILKDTFKDLFGTDDTKEFKRMLAKSLILYLGGRATGMSGNQALAFAANKALDGGVQQQKRNEWNKSKAAKAFTEESRAKYVKTGNTDFLKDVAAGPVLRGDNTKRKLFIGGIDGPVAVFKDKAGNGEYVEINGRIIPVSDLPGTPVDYRPEFNSEKQQSFYTKVVDGLIKSKFPEGDTTGIDPVRAAAQVQAELTKILRSHGGTPVEHRAKVNQALSNYVENARRTGKAGATAAPYLAALLVPVAMNAGSLANELATVDAQKVLDLQDAIEDKVHTYLEKNNITELPKADYETEVKEAWANALASWQVASKDPKIKKQYEGYAKDNPGSNAFQLFITEQFREGSEASKFAADNEDEIVKFTKTIMNKWR